MRTIEINLYKFNELSDEAKRNAMDSYLSEGFEMHWRDEAEESLNEFCKIFPVTVKGWEIGYRKYINYRLDADEEILNLSGPRLLSYVWNNYKIDLWRRKYLSLTPGIVSGSDKYYSEIPYRHRMVKFNYLNAGPNKGKYYKSYYSNIQKEETCNLTGYIGDIGLLKPFWELWANFEKDITFKDCLEAALNNWLEEFQNDWEWQQSEEYLADHFAANDYEFTEDGERA